MLFGNDKDLAALRAGIRAQEADALREVQSKRDWDRRKRRRRANGVAWKNIGSLRPKNYIVGTEDGMNFYGVREVLSIQFEVTERGDKLRDDECWVGYRMLDSGSTGASRWKIADQVLYAPLGLQDPVV